ncbi:molybdate ABC transporter substrate-binding protein [Ferrimonas marina]|uniref:Molybdate transport system substrate-binding protein n=1 Tax=Ferrimonas marina TaxID=299255 RepID=A0A1M5XUP8_9GAMM|nr:molybdate ABC transporter substrate-binding protein [Ferrimonas marina]SHI03545.1 molybdate transport system substrate-binding protein [Ferrimonas marina]
MRWLLGGILWCAAATCWAEVELRVAVAANFAPTLQSLVPAFEQQSGVRVRISTGSTGGLFTQIVHGAPYDLFLAADARRPTLLEQRELIVADSRVTYAIGVLAFWTPGSTASEARLRQWDERLAVANPRTAPYGQAAQSVLARLQQLKPLHGKLVRGSNILQTFQFVQSGNVNGGLVAWAQLQRIKMDPAEYWLIPSHWYPALEQQAVVLKRSEHPKQAQALLAFLLAQQEQLSRSGYRQPDPLPAG